MGLIPLRRHGRRPGTDRRAKIPQKDFKDVKDSKGNIQDPFSLVVLAVLEVLAVLVPQFERWFNSATPSAKSA
jgi:hypothetical protein